MTLTDRRSIELLSDAELPDQVVLDTNVLVAWMLSFFQRPLTRQHDQAKRLVERLNALDRTVIVTPSGFGELVHVSIRDRYQREIRERGSKSSEHMGRRISSWVALYKRDVSMLRHHAFELERLRIALTVYNVVIASPNDFAPFPATQPFDRELIRMVGRYGLDTSDCLILMEAERLGVRSIVTMDRDLLRASEDFDILTWS